MVKCQRMTNKTNRNDPCPCGSGKKYKKCHLETDQASEREELTRVAGILEWASAGLACMICGTAGRCLPWKPLPMALIKSTNTCSR